MRLSEIVTQDNPDPLLYTIIKKMLDDGKEIFASFNGDQATAPWSGDVIAITLRPLVGAVWIFRKPQSRDDEDIFDTPIRTFDQKFTIRKHDGVTVLENK
jgi:hypothetical protein